MSREELLAEIKAYQARRAHFAHVRAVASACVALPVVALWLCGLAEASWLGPGFARWPLAQEAEFGEWMFFTRASGQPVVSALSAWLAVLIAAAAIYALCSFSKGGRRDALESPVVRHAYATVGVTMLASVPMSAVLLYAGQPHALPPLWLLTYGAGLWPVGFHSGMPFRITAIGFMTFGALAAWRSDLGDALLVGGFGGLHLALSAMLLFTQRQPVSEA